MSGPEILDVALNLWRRAKASAAQVIRKTAWVRMHKLATRSRFRSTRPTRKTCPCCLTSSAFPQSRSTGTRISPKCWTSAPPRSNGAATDKSMEPLRRRSLTTDDLTALVHRYRAMTSSKPDTNGGVCITPTSCDPVTENDRLSFPKIHPPSALANRGEKDHG